MVQKLLAIKFFIASSKQHPARAYLLGERIRFEICARRVPITHLQQEYLTELLYSSFFREIILIANVAIKDNNISTNASDLDIDSDMLKKRKCRKEETVRS